jgi:hypothetical protein
MIFRLIGLCCVALSGAAQTFPPPMEKVLLPITVQSAPGAIGSTWTSYARVYDRALDRSAVIIPFDSCDEPDLGDELPTCDSPSGPTKPPRVFPLGFQPARPADTQGAITYVERSRAEDVHISLFLQLSGGVPLQIPVVREREFRDEIQLLDVPDYSQHRLMIRVYGSEPDRLGMVRVRVFTSNFPQAEQLLVDQLLELRVVQRYYVRRGTDSFRLPTRPPYAELYFGAPLTEADDSLRIEITPQTDNLRIWAMASVTANVGHRVTLRTP